MIYDFQQPFVVDAANDDHDASGGGACRCSSCSQLFFFVCNAGQDALDEDGRFTLEGT